MIKIRYKGLNWNTFESYVVSQGVCLYDINKNSYDDITFLVSKKDYIKITKMKYLQNIKLEIIDDNRGGFAGNNILTRIGIVIGLFVSIVGSTVFGKLTLQYNIYGLNTIDKRVVENALEGYGIQIGKINNFDNSDLENYLLQNIDGISFVSVMKKGTTICINFKEKDDVLTKNYANLISPYNMIVTSIDILSGSCCYKVGDVVLAGDTLVGAYDDSTHNSSYSVVGSIKGQAWWVGSVRFEKQKELLVPTGRKKTIRQAVFGEKVLNNLKSSSYFDVQKITYSESDYLSNFLPIKFLTTTFYECQKQIVVQNLEENKQLLLQESRLLAYNKVPANILISGEEQKIIDMGEYYLVNTYLTAHVEVKSAN